MKGVAIGGGNHVEATKLIVVLANSWKHKGRCIAGQEVTEWNDDGLSMGGWVRPVSTLPDGKLTPNHYQLLGGGEPEPLDIIEVPLDCEDDNSTQPENWVVREHDWWKYHGQLQSASLANLIETPTELWIQPGQSTDRVSAEYLISNPPDQSLYLIYVESAEVIPSYNRGYRLCFEYEGQEYGLKITDPAFEEQFEDELAAICSGDAFELDHTIVCLSLGTEFNGYHYKLVAAVFTDW